MTYEELQERTKELAWELGNLFYTSYSGHVCTITTKRGAIVTMAQRPSKVILMKCGIDEKGKPFGEQEKIDFLIELVG